MGKIEPRIALVCPSHPKVMSSFIKSHLNNLSGQVFYYYGGFMPNRLDEKKGEFVSPTWLLIDKIRGKLFKKDFKDFAFKRSLKENRINIVFAEYGVTGVYVQEVCEELEIPLLVSFLGYDASKKSILNEYRAQYLSLFKYMSKGICVARSLIDNLVDLGGERQKFVYSPCAPGREFAVAKPKFNSKTFFALGRFVDKKAPYFTLEAFRKLLNKHPDAHLYFGGDGMLLSTCKNLVDYWGISDSVSFISKLSAEECFSYYEESLAFIQHSITADSGDTEGTPVAILEASYAGIPVVSTLHAGIPDVIINKKTGFLVPEKNVNAMVEAMDRLASNFDLAKKMGSLGRKNIEENFSIEVHSNILNKLVEEAIN